MMFALAVYFISEVHANRALVIDPPFDSEGHEERP
jgi:hypothetical protein